MSHEDHDHEGPCLHVDPVRAFEIQVGDMLAGPGKSSPRVCLVTFTHRDEETDTVTLNILDARIWEANEGECQEAKLELDALNIVGRVVKDH